MGKIYSKEIQKQLETLKNNPNYIILKIIEEENRVVSKRKTSIEELSNLINYLAPWPYRFTNSISPLYFHDLAWEKDLTQVTRLFKLHILTHPTRGIINNICNITLAKEEDPNNCLKDILYIAQELKRLLEDWPNNEEDEKLWHKLSISTSTLMVRVAYYGAHSKLNTSTSAIVQALDAIFATKTGKITGQGINSDMDDNHTWSAVQLICRNYMFLTKEEAALNEREQLKEDAKECAQYNEIVSRSGFSKDARRIMHRTQLNSLLECLLDEAPHFKKVGSS